MASKLPYYPLYVDDFDDDEHVLSMNLTEIGLYQLALNSAWRHGSIPNDPMELARVIRQRHSDVKKAWNRVKERFTESGRPGRLVNKRQEEERKKAIDKQATASKAGRASVISRQRPFNVRSTDVPTSVPTVVQPRASGSGSISDSENKTTSESAKNPGIDQWHTFLVLWSRPCDCCGMQFEVKQVDQACQQWLSLWEAGRITDRTYPEVVSGLERWRSSREWHKDDGKFVPSMATWLGYSKDGRPAEPRWNDRPVAKGDYD